MSKIFNSPFMHFTVPNFLNQKDYQTLVKVYSKFQFIEKDSDLFHFFQTNELVDEPQIQFFKKSLETELSKLTDMKDTSFNIFASYYFKGDYLLCHDDVIDDRKFAFSYYLEDFDSGELVLFDETAMKAVKKIKVAKNTLAVFQVSNISYHEVAYCKENGRKAVTGWLNIKGLGAKRQQKKIENFKQNIPKEAFHFELPGNLEKQDNSFVPGIDYTFDASSQRIQGPFYSRKNTKLQLKDIVVFDLKGYQLFSADFYKYKEGDYMLLNDSVNMLEGQIIDIFVTKLPQGSDPSDEFIVQIAGQNGIQGGIPYVSDSVFVIKRGRQQYCIERVKKQFLLGHMIYLKKQKSIKNTKSTNVKKTARQIRQNIMKKKNEENKKVPVRILDDNLKEKIQKSEKKLKGKDIVQKKVQKLGSKILQKSENSRRIKKPLNKMKSKR